LGGANRPFVRNLTKGHCRRPLTPKKKSPEILGGIDFLIAASISKEFFAGVRR
jgi:hypothetical protein